MPELLENWTVQMRKGILELCILRSLSQTNRYGYDLAKSLVALPGLNTKEGTIYPLLSRLRAGGLVKSQLVESPEGPARKYYSLTQHGRDQLALMNAFFQTLSQSLNDAEMKGERK